MLTGMKVTFVTMIQTIFNPKKHLRTVNYPLVKEEPVARARGVIALDQEACTVCMLCARNCPDWCIYIEGHKEEKQPDKPGAGSRSGPNSTVSTSTTPSACTAASASRSARSTPSSGAPSTSTPRRHMGKMMHDMDKLQDWLETVPEAPALES
jgi:NADH-quinone oxidoreductase subunit I